MRKFQVDMAALVFFASAAFDELQPEPNLWPAAAPSKVGRTFLAGASQPAGCSDEISCPDAIGCLDETRVRFPFAISNFPSARTEL